MLREVASNQTRPRWAKSTNGIRVANRHAKKSMRVHILQCYKTVLSQESGFRSFFRESSKTKQQKEAHAYVHTYTCLREIVKKRGPLSVQKAKHAPSPEFDHQKSNLNFLFLRTCEIHSTKNKASLGCHWVGPTGNWLQGISKIKIERLTVASFLQSLRLLWEKHLGFSILKTSSCSIRDHVRDS